LKRRRTDELMTVVGTEIERYANSSSVIVSVESPRGEAEWCVGHHRQSATPPWPEHVP
jgi:hypothetical protein